MQGTFHCVDCNEDICITCSNQCHNGHDIQIHDTGANCKCRHENPKIKLFSKAFEENDLEELKKLLFEKYKEKAVEILKEKDKEASDLNWENIKRMVENMKIEELTYWLNNIDEMFF